jgi:hypothetical protein
LVVVPALYLGAVHGNVGILHQGISVLAVVGVDSNPDAGSDVDFVAIKDKWLSKRLQDSLGNLDRVSIFPDPWE